MVDTEKIIPYTVSSFKRQIKLLKEELSDLGVKISDDDAARISFLARRKYDRYDHFFPGETFESRLLKWLGINFEKDERQTAFEIVQGLKFVSAYEMRELSKMAFEKARFGILDVLKDVPTTDWYTYIESRNRKIEEEIMKSVFVAFADDIGFDFFRRYADTHYFFEKENFVEYYKIHKSSLDELPKFNRIFLLDQLSASGTTAIRYSEGKWEGKIPTFREIWKDYIEGTPVYYCPYILSSVSEKNLKARLGQYLQENSKMRIFINPTCRISISSCVTNKDGTGIDENKPVSRLCRKYYDRFKPDEHIQKGGSACYGYGGAGLTLVLQSNCPNDSIYLLWHSFNDWYPLFPRVSHHR